MITASCFTKLLGDFLLPPLTPPPAYYRSFGLKKYMTPPPKYQDVSTNRARIQVSININNNE